MGATVGSTRGCTGIEEIGVTSLTCWTPEFETPDACGCSETAPAAGMGANEMGRFDRLEAVEATPKAADS
jgi:hypothetical protein